MTKKEQQKQAYEYFKSLGKSYLGIIGKDPKDNRIVQSMKDHKKFGFEQSETWGFGSQLVEYIIPRLQFIIEQLDYDAGANWAKYIKELREILWYLQELANDENPEIPTEQQYFHRIIHDKDYKKRINKAEKLLPKLFGLWW